MPTIEWDVTAGLRENRRVPVNTPAFEQYRGLTATRWGGIASWPITPLLDAGTLAGLGTVAWPFPQVFHGHGVTLLAFETAVYRVENGQATALTLYNVHDMDRDGAAGERPVPAGGGAWQFASFHGSWMLCNRACTVFKTGFHDVVWIATTDHESLENGDFDGDAAGWDTGVSGWSYNDGGMVHTPGAPGSFTQIPASQATGFEVAAGREYEVSLTVEGRTAGTVDVRLGSQTPAVFSTNGTHVVRLVAPAARTMQVSASAAFDGKVTLVSCRKTSPTVQMCGNWRDGRAVLGGFNPLNHYNVVDWPGELAGYRTDAPQEVQDALAAYGRGGAAQNWCWWSSIGGDDLLRLFSLKAMKYFSFESEPGMGFDDERPYWLDLIYRNESGYMVMPFGGAVAASLPIGVGRDYMAVYGAAANGGAGGVAVLYGRDERVGQDGIDNLGQGVGVANSGAVAGGPEAHIMVDGAGGVWRIAPDRDRIVAEYLDRQDYVGELELGNVRVCYEPYRREHYIADGTDGFVLSRDGGWSRPPWMPTSLFFSGAESQGILFEAADEAEMELVTCRFNARLFGGAAGDAFQVFGVRAETTDIDTSGWQVSVGVRKRLDRAMAWMPAVPLSRAGDVALTGPAVEAQVRLLHGDRTKTTGIGGLFIDGRLNGLDSEAWLDVEPEAATL